MSKLTPLFAPLRRGGTALARSINRVSTVRARIVFATLCVVAVAALAVTGYFTYQVRTQDQQRDDRAQHSRPCAPEYRTCCPTTAMAI